MSFKNGSFMALSSTGKTPKNEFPTGTIFGKNLAGREYAKIPTEATIFQGLYAIHEDGRAGQGKWTVSDCTSGMVIQYFDKKTQAQYFVKRLYVLYGAFPVKQISDYDFEPDMDKIDMPGFIALLRGARAK